MTSIKFIITIPKSDAARLLDKLPGDAPDYLVENLTKLKSQTGPGEFRLAWNVTIEKSDGALSNSIPEMFLASSGFVVVDVTN